MKAVRGGSRFPYQGSAAPKDKGYERLCRLEELFRQTMESIALAAQALALRVPEDHRIHGAVDALLDDINRREHPA